MVLGYGDRVGSDQVACLLVGGGQLMEEAVHEVTFCDRGDGCVWHGVQHRGCWFCCFGYYFEYGQRFGGVVWYVDVVGYFD